MICDGSDDHDDGNYDDGDDDNDNDRTLSHSCYLPKGKTFNNHFGGDIFVHGNKKSAWIEWK